MPSNPAPNKGNNLQDTTYLMFWREKNELILSVIPWPWAMPLLNRRNWLHRAKLMNTLQIVLQIFRVPLLQILGPATLLSISQCQQNVKPSYNNLTLFSFQSTRSCGYAGNDVTDDTYTLQQVIHNCWPGVGYINDSTTVVEGSVLLVQWLV